jgi:class 3 adenylate cyclase/integral membrane sensor domain MASE1
VPFLKHLDASLIRRNIPRITDYSNPPSFEQNYRTYFWSEVTHPNLLNFMPLIRNRTWRYLVMVAVLALCQFGITKLIFMVPIEQQGMRVWPLWLPAGLAQAALLLFGRRLYPGVAIGSFLFALSQAMSWPLAVAIAFNNTLQPLVGATLLKRVGFRNNLQRQQDVIALFALATILPSALSATVGMLTINLAGLMEWANLGKNWFQWWIGNVTGTLTLMPVLLTCQQWAAIAKTPRHSAEAFAWLCLLTAASWLIFCPTGETPFAPYSVASLAFPLIIWGALRFGQMGAALSTAIITNIATWGVIQAKGPFIVAAVNNPAVQPVESLQAFICVTALTALTLAAIMAEREQMKVWLQAEKEKSEQLLLNILPLPIANQLKKNHRTIADSFAEATVLFADIVNFTKLSAKLSPQELVALLNEIFSAFDQLAEQYGLEKIKTIGDAYMVVGGLPFPQANHAEAIADMALEMQAEMRRFSDRHQQPFSMRIGINTGPVVAGVIGTKKFIYDLWGDTVNVASRMESQGIAGQIQVTEATYECLCDRYHFESRGEVYVKGKGQMPTYILAGRKAAPVALPTVQA